MLDLSKVKIKAVILFGLAFMAFAAGGDAQGFSMERGRSMEVPSQGNAPIAVGPFLFSPALQLGWENHSNLWRSATDPVEDEITVTRLRLLFEMPIRESFVRISYTPRYRDFKNTVVRDNWEHLLDVSGDFEFSNGLTVRAFYQFTRGDSSIGSVDPGGELVYNGQPFTRQHFAVDTSYWFSSTDGLQFNVSTSDVDWQGDPVSGGESWFDYRENRVRTGWLHQLNPLLVMDVSLTFIDYSTDDLREISRDYTSTSVTAAFRGQLNSVLSTQIRFGYADVNFSASAEAEPGFQAAAGFVVDGEITWALGSESKLRLDLVGRPFASNYDSNSYYNTTAGRLLYDVDFGRLFGQARARLQHNSYDVPDSVLGVKRSDDIMTLSAGLGFRFTDRLSVRAAYSYEDRDSLAPYSYSNEIWLLDLIFGY